MIKIANKKRLRIGFLLLVLLITFSACDHFKEPNLVIQEVNTGVTYEGRTPYHSGIVKNEGNETAMFVWAKITVYEDEEKTKRLTWKENYLSHIEPGDTKRFRFYHYNLDSLTNIDIYEIEFSYD